MIVIDATDLIIGRMATVAAKKALLGEEVIIVNSDKAIISGKRREIRAKYENTRNRGAPLVGPFFPRQADRFVKRTIRGMLPYKQPKGDAAFKRIMCFRGVPETFKDKKIETIHAAHISKLTKVNHLTVKEICEFLGGK